MKEYKKLLLSELRLAVYNKDQEMTDESLIKAVTVNQNLLSLGYTLKPSDIVLLSKSSSLDTFYESIKELMNDVKAKPMYPNFPEQVMEMEEAEFRFHQLIHYFSTYGLEFFFGVNVSKSWLPDVKDTEKTEDDETLLNAKVIELISKEDMYIVPFIKILSKRERMTLPEKEIINTACSFISDDMLKDIQIPFKENLLTIFYTVFKNENLDSKKKQELLHSLCQHTGDVLKCCDYILSKERFKLRTSQKRLLVKLLNSYPIEDFKANVILSAKKAERSLLILQYLDYMNYSRSIDHSGVVNKLRNKYLESWESQVKYLLENDKNNALDFIAKRPGSMLRMIAWLLRLGYDAQAVEDKLIKNANVLSTQTLVSILNAFGNKRQEDRDEHHAKVCSIVRNLLKAKLESIETSIQNKKVYIEQGNFNFAESVINTNNKSAEGGYIRSGLAYKIPENVNRLRFFVYWNDKVRVDVDLHAAGISKSGKNIHVGWNAYFKNEGVVSSGDITHSDAAEYIDVDLTQNLKEIAFNINLFHGRSGFGDIEECYVGLMAVKNLNEKVKLYNPKNCFFSHNLKGMDKFMNYGYINVEKRILIFDGSGDDNTERNWYKYNEHKQPEFSLMDYVDLLTKVQNVEIVNDKTDAEIILILDKPSSDNEVSLIDENFFMDK